MPSCQMPKFSDTLLRATPANDNNLQIDCLMKSFELGSILSQRDYTKPSKRNHVGFIVMATVCVLAIAVFVVRLAV
jgi:hypothetical protein